MSKKLEGIATGNSTETLQGSHDELARVMAVFLDQMIRGSHPPLVYQWLWCAQALRTAAPHVGSHAWGLTPQYLIDVADLIQRECDNPANRMKRQP